MRLTIGANHPTRAVSRHITHEAPRRGTRAACCPAPYYAQVRVQSGCLEHGSAPSGRLWRSHYQPRVRQRSLFGAWALEPFTAPLGWRKIWLSLSQRCNLRLVPLRMSAAAMGISRRLVSLFIPRGFPYGNGTRPKDATLRPSRPVVTCRAGFSEGQRGIRAPGPLGL